MGIRHLAGATVLVAGLLAAMPSAEGADEIVFPPNEWVAMCDVDSFSDVNGSGQATAMVGEDAYVYDLHAGTRTALHHGTVPRAINDTGLVVGDYLPDDPNVSIGFVEDVSTGKFTAVDPGIGDFSGLVSINLAGVAVGTYVEETTEGVRPGVFLYDHTSGDITDLGGVGEAAATGVGISDDGIVIGARGPSFSEPMSAFWHDLDSGSTEVIEAHGGESVWVQAISGSLVVGAERLDPTAGSSAFLENLATGEVSNLGLPPTPGSGASDVNADGIVVGTQDESLPESGAIAAPTAPTAPTAPAVGHEPRLSVAIPYEAFSYDSATGDRRDLGSLGGGYSFIRALNDDGLGVGQSAGGDLQFCSTVLQLRLPPRPPASPSVELFGTTASLSWDPTFDGYGEVTYVVHFDGLEVARVSAPLTSVALPDVPCSGGTYTVTAANSEGASAPSEGAVLVARSCTPATPAVPVPATPTFTG